MLLHPIDQHGSPCCHNFLTANQNYHRQVTPIGALDAEKVAEAVFLYVSAIAFPASINLVI